MAAAACALGGTGGVAAASPSAKRIEGGRPFVLRPGESAATADGALRVGLDAVIGDSRCPRGERCVWAGKATLRLWVQPAAAARSAHELHPGDAVPAGPLEVRLEALDPYPTSGRTIPPGDYRATLRLMAPAAPASASER